MIRTSLLIVCFTAFALGSVIPPELNQTTDEQPNWNQIKQDLDWTEIKEKLVYEQKSHTFNRLLIRLNLHTIFPFLSNFTKYPSANIITIITPQQGKRSDRPLDYFFFNNQQEIYFLSSFQKPTNLMLNFHLTTDVLGEQFEKTITVNNKITSIGYPVEHVLSFTVRNATFAQVLDAEFNLLRYFRTSLWTKPILLFTTQNHNLDIITFKPHGQSFNFEIGSSEEPSERLHRLLIYKENNVDRCNLDWTPELEEFKRETGLELDLCSLQYSKTSYDYSPDENYTVDAHYSVMIYDGLASYSIGEMIILTVCVLASAFLLSIFVLIIYRSVHAYVSGLSKQVCQK